jgi:hypothetical protein
MPRLDSSQYRQPLFLFSNIIQEKSRYIGRAFHERQTLNTFSRPDVLLGLYYANSTHTVRVVPALTYSFLHVGVSC